MKKPFHINIILALGFVAAILVSCNNFDDLNINPDGADKVSPSMIATEVLKSTFRLYNPNPTDFGTANLWNKHTAMLDPTPIPGQYYYSYWPYIGFGSFKMLTDTRLMTEAAAGFINENSYKGLSLFLKAWWGFDMTTQLGDIPYAETGRYNEGISKPKYDKQEDVFVYILEDLKAAEVLFAAGAPFEGDIMLGGDHTKWRRLCNAMQLKVIQTISRKATAAQKARFAEIVTAGNLMSSNADIFQLEYTTNTNASHPAYGGEDRRNYQAISKLMVDELIRLQDRRLFYFADPAPAKLAAGLSENEYGAYVGAPTELISAQLALNHEHGAYSLYNIRYNKQRDGDPKIHFTYAEQCFILAEAIEEGWIAGDAKGFYESGVTAMLEYYRDLPSAGASYTHGMPITDAYIDDYFDGAAGYATTGSKTDRLQQVWMQRWMIDYFQGNGGNYPQVLRTGYPVYPLDPATSMNTDDVNAYPKRWKYDTNENKTNGEEYNRVIQEQYDGYDGINLAPWFLQ